jgi:hypothetical protein
MVTDSLHQENTESKPVGFFGRATGQLRQFVCGLHGHDALLHFDRGRMSLLCTSCGYESPGWDIREAPASASRERVETGRMASLPLVRARRVA